MTKTHTARAPHRPDECENMGKLDRKLITPQIGSVAVVVPLSALRGVKFITINLHIITDERA